MCRLVAYLGHDVLLEDVLVKPINSIVMQSLHARESALPTNGDGFGLGWYVPGIATTPAVFKSISPAWNDENLLHLTAKIKSPAFFAHVRAASTGGVTQYNCHPFIYGPWMAMHNGEIGCFMEVKRHLRHLLDDEIYNWVKGTTDSEHLFALFLQRAKGRDLSRVSVVAEVLKETFAVVLQLINEFSDGEPSYFNVCITNGHCLVASRYCSDCTLVPETMHYSLGARFEAKEGRYHMIQEGGNHQSLLVTSEKLTNFEAEWQDMPPNHLLLVDTDLGIQIQKI